MLFVLKIEGIFGKEKSNARVLKEVVFFICSIDVDYSTLKINYTHKRNKKTDRQTKSIILNVNVCVYIYLRG